MEINGTVTITLNDYSRLHKVAKQGIKSLALHRELFSKLSSCITDIVYDPELDQADAQRVLERVQALSASLPDINFYSDPEHSRVIIEPATKKKQPNEE